MNDDTCRERLPAYLEGSLTDAERAAVEAHLEGSASCRERLAALEGLDTLLTQLPREVDVPAALTERILAATLGNAAGHHEDHRSRPNSSASGNAEGGTEDRSSGQAPARIEPPSASGRTVALPKRILWWATAAAVLVTAVIGWRLTRPDPDARKGDPIAEHDGQRTAVAARMVTARGVGRPPADARCRVYDSKVAKVFHDLTVMRIVPALSWQNLSILREAPYRELETDQAGRLLVTRPLDAGVHLVAVEKAGHLGAWGLIGTVEPTDDGAPASLPRLEVFLHPARDIRLRGRVVDAETGQPIANAIIATPDGTGTAVSGKDGSFSGVAHVRVDKTPSFYALANGYAPFVLKPSANDYGALAPRLTPRPSFDVRFEVVDPDGRPLRQALVLATPIRSGAASRDATGRHATGGDDVWAGLPASERKRPEVGVTDDDGAARLRGLYGGRYAIVVHHANGVLRGRTIDAAKVGDEPIRLEVAPDGDGSLDVTVETADGDGHLDTVVFLTRAPDGDKDKMSRLISQRLDLEGDTRFRRLADGEHTVQIFTREGFGYYVTLQLDRSDPASMTYVLPKGVHTIAGRVNAKSRAAISMIRIEGELPRERFGRRRARLHRFVVEVPVQKDGSFTTPALPPTRNVRIFGRSVATADVIFKMATTQPTERALGEALRGREAKTHRIEVKPTN